MINSVSGLLFTPAAVRPSGAAESTAAHDFQSVVKSIAADSAGAFKAAEGAAVSSMTGGASVSQVVSSVMAAEQSLQMAISIRDRIVAAYGEISRMNI